MAVAELIIAALYFGREIFVPLALAVLLSFVLAPFVTWMRGRACQSGKNCRYDRV
jgi:predicted PurR-regulated permease PerM